MQGLNAGDPPRCDGSDLPEQHDRGRIRAATPRALDQRCAACVLGLLAVLTLMSHAVAAPPSAARRSAPNKSVRSVRDGLRLAQLNVEATDSLATPAAPVLAPTPNVAPQLQSAESPPASDEDPAELPPSNEYRIPLRAPNLENIRMKSTDGLISLVAREGSLADIITLLAETQGLNVVTADPLDVAITITLDRVTLDDALDAILSVTGYTWTINKNIILITNVASGAAVSPNTQGLRLQIFNLDYALARDINTAITGMLSPVGNAFIMTSSDSESRQSREVVGVHDLPPYVDRISEYIAQVDIPPRQVLIEVHILQVDLDATNRHGVNLDQIFRRDGNLLFEMHTTGLATTTPSQAFTFRFSDGNLGAFLEMLRTTTDAKTLASPRILAINGQLSRIQVGEQLGFRVTTTTETSTTQSVDFIDVGVVLEVTPRISRDGRILLSVRPEVSSGRVNPDTGLPEEKTTELDTDVLLCDNEGVVIGGLLQEADNDTRQQLPWLGNLKVLGHLFRRTEDTKSRKEIIMALVPRLVPYQPNYNQFEADKFQQAQTRLLEGSLCPVLRPWEAAHPEYRLDTWHTPNWLPPWQEPYPMDPFLAPQSWPNAYHAATQSEVSPSDRANNSFSGSTGPVVTEEEQPLPANAPSSVPAEGPHVRPESLRMSRLPHVSTSVDTIVTPGISRLPRTW